MTHENLEKGQQAFSKWLQLWAIPGSTPWALSKQFG
jgi:hypothetical protein